jgi:hypothetical protein
MFPSPHPHAQLQAIESIESTDPLAVHEPALSSQQHPNALIPKSQARMGQITNAHPQRRLIRGPTPPIPGRPTKLRKTTGPQATDLKGGLKPAGQFSTAGGP